MVGELLNAGGLPELVDDLGRNPSPEECIDLIGEWGLGVDRALAGAFDEHVGGFYGNPPCFGNVVRIGEGDYVSWARFETVLPDETEQNAWYLYSNTWRDEWPQIVFAINDPERLSQMASDSIERDDAVCFMTELMPRDFTEEELDEVRAGRPELFDDSGDPIVNDGWSEGLRAKRTIDGEIGRGKEKKAQSRKL